MHQVWNTSRLAAVKNFSFILQPTNAFIGQPFLTLNLSIIHNCFVVMIFEAKKKSENSQLKCGGFNTYFPKWVSLV